MSRITNPVSALLVFFAVGAFAQEAAPPKAPEAIPDPQAFVTRHTGTFDGAAVAYTARAGETYLRDGDGKPRASIFSFAYTRTEIGDPTRRPVMFIWNGGPGSASLWLHMGTFGPRRVVVPSDASNVGAPPYPLVDNPLTLLDVTDLVFVDPVGTGFSRPLGEHEGREFWGLDEDATSVAEFIERWITDNGRWNSPKFIAGESFGTTRAASVAEILEVERGISLNGIVMISQALDYEGSTPVDDNLISFITYLPTMAATAVYHGKVTLADGDLEAFLRQAREFAADELAPALIKGSALDEQERGRIRDRLVAFTGLDSAYVERADLRITGTRFRKELLRDRGLAVGRADTRYTRDDMDDTADRPEGDAASEGFKNAFIAVLNHYLRDELEVVLDRPYASSAEVYRDWNWRPDPGDRGGFSEPSYVNVARRLSNALRSNRDLRVLVASGYYDMATPFYDAEFTFGRHAILRDRVEYTYYQSGHMMYVHGPSLERFMADVRRFVEEACR
jgi:carboxypeptidase C (cathepsin A)